MPRQRNVAVVDDDLNMLAGIENLLAAHGFTARVFASAEAFLASVCATTPIDCLVLDLHLGGLSGMDLWRKVKASGWTIPVIFMTAFDDEVLRREAVQEGCVAYFRKPFSSQLLIDALERYCAEHE